MEKFVEKDFNLLLNKKFIKNIKKNKFIKNINTLNKKLYKLIISLMKKYNFIINIILFFLAYYLYYLSFEKCFEGLAKCGRKTNWIKKKMIQTSISSIILFILIEMIFLEKIARLHLIHVILVYFSLYRYSHGMEFYDHGFFNFIGSILIIIICIIIILPFNILLYLIKKNNKKLIFFYLIFLIIILIVYLYYINSLLICKDWQKGLNNTYIENNYNKYGCQIRIPKFCPYIIGQYFFDVTKRTGIKCGKNIYSKNNLLKFAKSSYINKNTKIFGFPLTNKDPKCFIRTNEFKNKNVLRFIQKNMIDMNNKELLKKIGEKNMPEITVDFTNNTDGKINIQLNFNETLSKERKKLEKTNPNSKNIIILYFDSISRTTGLRQLKKTFNFIEQFMPYKGKANKDYPQEKYHSFQFLKYHSFKYYTRGNYPKLFYWTDKSKKMIRITKFLKQNGYITAFSNDLCARDSCWLPQDITLEEICDYELILCDPNMKSANSMVKKCLYDKINADYQYEYGYKFWVKYRNNKKFLLIVNNDGHEGTLEILKYDDDIVFNFLNKLFLQNLFKETTIILLSDHGCPMPSIYYFNEFFKLELNLPMCYILTNDKENVSYILQYKYIYENQQNFITAYDIYNTIIYLVYGNNYSKNNTPKSKLGINLFSKINPKRTPKDYIDMDIKTCI